MASSAPRLRSDLTVSEQETAGGQAFVCKDPVSGAFFRFGEAERFIAQQLDGETPMDVVRQRTEVRFGASMSTESLDAFLRSLYKNGLLESSRTQKKSGRQGRFRGSLLYLRFALWDPDRLLSRVARHVGSFYTPLFVVLAVSTILLAGASTLANWDSLRGELAQFARLSAVPPLLAVAFLVASFHEMAHGLTCKRFGGSVPEMGFMLIYFQPALYCNVSDAWLFPEKRRRLWVGFAGPFFELFLWALAGLVWSTTEVSASVHDLALLVMTVAGVNTLLNFNPLIKLDGYYLLSDYLEIPNLREKSFRYLGGLFDRLLGTGSPAEPRPPRRERRIYLWYGLAATVVSFAILAWVTLTLGGFLLDHHQPLALMLLGGVVGTRVRRRLGKIFGKAADEPEKPDAQAQAPSPAGETGGTRSRRRGRLAARRLRWMLAAAAAATLMVLAPWELRIGGGFTVLPEENADVRAGTEGIVQTIAVDEGDTVEAGGVVARLSNHALGAELEKTRSAIREGRANLSKLLAGPTAAELGVMTAGVAKAEGRLEYAGKRVARLRQLAEQDLITRTEYEDALQMEAVARNDVAEFNGRLELLRTRTRPEDLEATRARLELLEAQQRFLEGEARELTVVSPVRGIVATPSRQLREMRGQQVTRGALIAKVYDFAEVTGHIVVSEKEIADVWEGQEVVLRARAFPDAAFRGTVTAIATAAEGSSAPGALTRPGGGAAGPDAGGTPEQGFVVTTRIDNRSLLLKPGMTGHAKVLGGERRIASLVARRLARTFKVEMWSWW